MKYTPAKFSWLIPESRQQKSYYLPGKYLLSLHPTNKKAAQSALNLTKRLYKPALPYPINHPWILHKKTSCRYTHKLIDVK